ncbi:hypothetical protein HJC23_011643 [Cyclotella cryptica]|uniref:Sec1-like protein n=1 Tax=Cyclotella cryptica TaxID=29204 RepID=A0ABD3QRL8_9STRA|eukprot:CCRYP_002779-RA/>CCRYP_002779-RA protein AED:0.22 eAED:0.26 QI:0/-1/0/1/-1/1/1/0/678
MSMKEAHPPAVASTLKACQLSAITAMLAAESSSSTPWKILIYDQHTRSIISPLLSVSSLRSLGVTLHLLLHSDREPIPDVPAVYFVTPTKENLDRIARDCSRSLYKCARIHLASRLNRSQMEEFARLVVNTGGLAQIESVYDNYVDFVSLEGGLFDLAVKESYVLYNHPGTDEREMEAAMDGICAGLFSVVVTLGAVPILRCARGGAPEMVGRKLAKMIGEHPTLLRRTTGGMAGQHHRPVLIILDRNMDLITPVHHVSTYQALVDDVLEHAANRVEFSVSADGEKGAASRGGRGAPPPPVRKKFDIDPDADPFYRQHKFNPFPEAIESNGSELQDVSLRERQIRSKTSGADENASAVGAPSSTGADLATAVESLPLLLERKKKLEVHTSILQAVMNEVASRDVPQFYELETSLATGTYKNDPAKAKKDVLELVTDPSKGNVDDKIRLVVVYMLSAAAKNADVDEVANGMKEALDTRGSAISTGDVASSNEGASRGILTKQDRIRLENGMRAIEYLKKIRSMQMIPSMSNIIQADDGTSYGGVASSDMLTSFMARATNQATGLLAKATDRLGTMMMGKIHKHHATIVVENICEMRPNTEDDDYLYLDPRVKGDVDVAALRNTVTRAPVREVVVFMIGGGCYGEYQNLQMVAKEGRNITYGATEIVDPCTFMNYLGKLV